MTTSAPQARTGRMRHRAELQGKDTTADGSGGWENGWVTERKIWCWIRPISGSQKMESMRRESQISHEIMARYNPDVTTEKRLKYRGKVYNIEAVWSPDEREEFVEMIATEGVAT